MPKKKKSVSQLNYQLPLFGFLAVSIAMTTLLAIQGTSLDVRNRAADLIYPTTVLPTDIPPTSIPRTPTQIPQQPTITATPRPLSSPTPRPLPTNTPRIIFTPVPTTATATIAPTKQVATPTTKPTATIAPQPTPQPTESILPIQEATTPNSETLFASLQERIVSFLSPNRSTSTLPVESATGEIASEPMPIQAAPRKDILDQISTFVTNILVPPPPKPQDSVPKIHPLTTLWKQIDDTIVRYFTNKPSPTPLPTPPPPAENEQ